MAKKVFELAKEMGLKSRELIEKAATFDIHIKSHMSALSDSDIDKIKKNLGKSTPSKIANGRKVPIGKPIVDEAFLANKKKPPVGKPLVDEAMLSKREKTEKVEKVEKAKKEDLIKEDSELKKDIAKKAETKKGQEKPSKSQVAKPKEIEQKNENIKKKEKSDSKVKTIESEKISMPKIKIISKAEDNRKKDAEAKKEEKAKRETAKVTNIKEKKERKKYSNRSGDNDVATTNRSEGRSRRRKDGEAGERGGSRNQRNKRDFSGERSNRRGFSRSAESSKTSLRADDAIPTSGKSRSRREDRKAYAKNDERNKFAKFERKSLEKKERKKYVKPKQEVVEEVVEETLPEGTVKINVPITVAGFCEQSETSTSKVIMTLMKMGIMANINQNLDEETLLVVADELGLNVIIGRVEEEEREEGIEDFKDREKDLKSRPPIITVMGHVDHGKTSLLDAIRKTNVTSTESGGITQHIGASEVSINGQKIVFLDTPGHEAFTAMRARGAHVTDIAVLVVAADDSVKPQTIESISHAKAAGVPIIVAINKMDKPGANPDLVKKDLADNGVLVEDWGGDVISVPVSAKTGDGINNLLEMILLQAEVLELKANPNRLALGSVIEAKLDKNRGPVASLLILNGTLQAGQSIVAGTCSGRIRLMNNDKGEKIKKSGPATAVEILGLTDVPQAGDEFNAVRDDKVAREIAEHRKEKLREEVLAKNSSMTLDKLFSQIKEGETKELNLIIKGDVQGSVGALISSLEKLNNDEVKVNVVHSGVGTISESDIMLAGTSDAVIIGFNVRPTTSITTIADQNGVEIRLYRVIYDVINDVEAAMKGLLDPEFKEEVLGKAEVRNTFKVPGIGIVAGAYITEGKVARNKEVRLVRDGIVIHEGKISSLKRFKDDAKEVAQGYECGIGIESYNDIKEGDVIECFTMVEIERK